MTMVFLHGLDSSSKGTKARWFRERFPDMLIPDLSGPLSTRMEVLRILLEDREDAVLVGSSFGGLMAALYVRECPARTRRVILLAPALNFPDFSIDQSAKSAVPAQLYIGSRDDVCPPDIVIEAAQAAFSDIAIQVVDDDHLLRDTFAAINWQELLSA